MMRTLQRTSATVLPRLTNNNRVTITRSFATVNPPVLFDYQTIISNLKPSVAGVEAIENCFGKLAKGEVDVPIPMHIGINESAVSHTISYFVKKCELKL